MTSQLNFNFDDFESEDTMRKTKPLRCPLCRKLPRNLADPNIGYAYSCLCRCAMLGRFSFYQQIAIDDWNHLVLKQQEKMDKIVPRKRRKTEMEL
jgi:hypothetical protein